MTANNNSAYINKASSALSVILILLNSPDTSSVHAFAFSPVGSQRAFTKATQSISFHGKNDDSKSHLHSTSLFATTIEPSSSSPSLLKVEEIGSSSNDSSSLDDKKDDEINRLLSMAAKLRAEAASMEAETAQELADAAENAFRQFDTNQDGEISVAELKEGLKTVLKTDLSDKRVEQLMKEFDKSGDGVLQLNEFVPTEQFRNRLQLLSREERRLASEAQQKAKEEEQFAILAEAKLDMINDRAPTGSDRLISIIPYLFPLMDGLQYGRFLLGSATGDDANPLLVGLAVLYGLYRTIPLSGLISYFALSTLSNNPTINRLIRFNMQQAIFLDIALFFPGLIVGLVGFLFKNGNSLPQGLMESGTDAVFVSLLLALTYCAGSSILGIIPNKLPFISDAVSNRMPSVDMLTIDSDGNIQLKEQDGDKDEDNKDL